MGPVSSGGVQSPRTPGISGYPKKFISEKNIVTNRIFLAVKASSIVRAAVRCKREQYSACCCAVTFNLALIAYHRDPFCAHCPSEPAGNRVDVRKLPGIAAGRPAGNVCP